MFAFCSNILDYSGKVLAPENGWPVRKVEPLENAVGDRGGEAGQRRPVPPRVVSAK